MSKQYLFINGAFHGAWCWNSVIRELAKLGGAGYAVDLPGQGLDRTPRHNITKSTYVRAASNFIAEQKLTNITLVGHSLGGVLIPDIVALNNQHIKEIFFIAGMVTDKGERAYDFIPLERREIYITKAKESGDGTVFWDFERVWKTWFHDFTEQEARGFYDQLVPQPFSVYLERSEASLDFGNKRVRYLLCKDDRALPRELCLEFSSKLGVVPVEIEAGHEVMLSHPAELAHLLLSEKAN